MNSTPLRRAIIPGIAALALAVSGCGAANEDDGGSSSGDGDSAGSLEGTLAGGGASTQQAAMGAWAVGFQDQHPDVTVEYDPVGSGGGRESFVSGAYPFAGSDSYLTDEEGELSGASERCGGGDPIEIPSYISPIALVYNIEGVDELNLTPEAIGGIFAGSITKWDDPAITEANPDAELSGPINPVHRSDESGTTGNFTTYLDAAAPDAWTDGEVETWPGKAGGEGAKGTSGVVQAVANGTGSIGYADASQTEDLGVANVGVGGEFVEPSAEAAAKILEVSPSAEGAADNQMIFDLDHNTEESGTYPVVLTSYLMACDTYEDENEAALVKEFLTYVVSDEGQDQAAAEAGSAPLSDDLQEQAQSILDGIGG